MKKKVREIKIHLNNNEDVYNKFNNDILSIDLGTYIYEQYLLLAEPADIKLKISSDEEMNDSYKNKLQDMIQHYFNTNLKELSRMHRVQNAKNILLSVIGICLVLIAHFLNFYNDFIISEVILVAGWVSLWEVFDNIMFKESKWQIKYNVFKRLCKSEFEFIDKK